MSLRLQLNLIITTLLGLFASVLIGLQIDNTRRSVREEVMGANVVAAQLLSRVRFVYGYSGLEGMRDFLDRVGRIRANDVELYDEAGQLLYKSPPSPYKSGRDAPDWYAQIVSPPLTPRDIELPNGRIVLRADPSRAALDGWDDLHPMLWLVLAGFAFGNLLVYALVGRAMRPVQQVVHALGRVAHGDYAIRLPTLPGHEGREIGQAFNRMAQSVQDSVLAQEQARQAEQALAQNRELTQMIQSRIEQERGAIARELHDELGQQVTAIKSIGLSIARRAQDRDEQTVQSARLVMDCADQIYDSVHGLIANLRPLALDRFGLADALNDLVADWRLRHTQTALQLKLDGNLAGLDDATSTAVYRVVQEAVNNALRHAQAERIEIAVTVGSQTLDIEVADNGHGLLDSMEQRGRFGVRGMRERVQALGGEFGLAQAQGGGIRVRARLPLASTRSGDGSEVDVGG